MARPIRLGEVDVSFVPAGHVLGSAQIVLEHKGERIVVSGDYKRRPDPTCAPFEPVPCDIFITEATFGLPVFRHPGDRRARSTGCSQRLHDNPERCILVGAYALGKAQRLIMELRGRGHHEPIYIHGALQRLCELYAQFGVPLGELRPATGVAEGRAEGPDRPRPARRAQRPLVAPPARSDHRHGLGLDAGPPARPPAQRRAAADRLRPCRLGRADRRPSRSSRPREVWITHGREEALKHWCMTRQIKARELNLVGYEDEDD